jgi:hypothetical protein
MISTDEEIDQLAEKVLATIETTSSKGLDSSGEVTEILHLTDPHRAKKLLQHMDSASNKSERDLGKKALVKALLMSTWLQRLYFVIWSFIMSILGAAITFLFIFVFGSINLPLEIVLGAVSFVFALVVSRLFDNQLVKLTQNIIEFLGNHKSIRSFIINHL